MKKVLGILMLVALFVTPLLGGGFNVGGALRYNYFTKSWNDNVKDRLGDFAFDTFRLNVSGEKAGITLDAEYRFYPEVSGGNFLHHGYMGYKFCENTEMQLGVHQVPFGLQPYASHNYFFSMPYYVGLEDDYDAGIKVLHKINDFSLAIAFYKNMEVPSAANNRYSIDIVNNDPDDPIQANEEVNQFNLRAAYNLGIVEIGASAQYGNVYNTVTEDNGTQTAFAGHINANYQRFNLKAEYIMYEIKPENGDGVDDSYVVMGSFGAPYGVASKANIIVGGLSYSLPLEFGPISNLTFYNDYSLMQKDEDNFEDSAMNVTGCMVKAGKVYAYIDYAIGQNHPWLGGSWTNGLVNGVNDPDWESRFNINLGYYF
ncbi:MAG: hypothetical protein PWQ09_199 [Candidatus Cloacimonadota bacterium]|nr:hypothetical protein [Candidatus Cloacimonadota bacterium]